MHIYQSGCTWDLSESGTKGSGIINKYIHTYTYRQTYTYTCICMSEWMYLRPLRIWNRKGRVIYMHTNIYTCVYKCMYVYTYISLSINLSMCIYICVCVYIYIDMCIYIYIHQSEGTSDLLESETKGQGIIYIYI